MKLSDLLALLMELHLQFNTTIQLLLLFLIEYTEYT